MATYSEIVGSGQYPAAATSYNTTHRVSAVIDASKINDGNGLASGDVVEAIAVPAGTMVMAVHTAVRTAEGATCTYGVGDGASATRYHATMDANSDSTDANVAPDYYYADQDTIDVTLDNAASSAVIQVDVVMANVAD